MKTIALASQKGGTGKTTLAIHLAVLALKRRERPVLIDTDPQRSSGDWWRARAQETPVFVETTVRKVPEVLQAARADGFTLAIIDTAPHAGPGITKISKLADLTLIPCRPAILDIRAIGTTVETVQGGAAIVLNACPPGRGPFEASITRETREVLAGYGLPVAPISIVNRVALAHALIDGRAVTEFEPGGKAAHEIARLWRWIKKEGFR